MSKYQPRRLEKVSTNYQRRKRNRFHHAVILACCVAVIAGVAVSAHALLRFPPSNSHKSVPTVASTAPSHTAAVSASPASPVNKNSWELRLVNTTHPLPQNFTVKTSPVGNARFDSRAAGTLKKMIADCNKNGNHLLICSAYRSISYQTTLYKTEIRKAASHGAADAASEAATVVAKPGTSEHNLGLAVDFGSIKNELCDETFEKTPESKWLVKNAYKYGFILRYQKGKENLTGIIYEPWHYRYVGAAAAKEMREKHLCLEEYLGQA
jgi:D-alanyl-D-alanine carboxypeptidase